jgi:tetratricopeptide (TPR) repeat protein
LLWRTASRDSLCRSWTTRARAGEARSHLERAVELDPSDGAAWHRLGRLLQDGGDSPALSLLALREAVRACPDTAMFWYDLSVAEHGSDRTDEAVAAARRATTLDADDVDAACHSGRSR